LRRSDDRESRPSWSRRLSLRQRILAVNIFAIAILAGSLFYLDGFRSRLTQARVEQAQSEAVMIAHMLAVLPAQAQPAVLARLGADSGTRLRVYRRDGARTAFICYNQEPAYEMRDPADEPWYRGVARALDNGFDAIVGASRRPMFRPPAADTLAAWPEARAALATRPGVVKSRNALMDAAYDDQVYVDDRTIDSHIKRLRKKFKVVDDDFDMIETLYGVGYRFKEV